MGDRGQKWVDWNQLGVRRKIELQNIRHMMNIRGLISREHVMFIWVVMPTIKSGENICSLLVKECNICRSGVWTSIRKYVSQCP